MKNILTETLDLIKKPLVYLLVLLIVYQLGRHSYSSTGTPDTFSTVTLDNNAKPSESTTKIRHKDLSPESGRILLLTGEVTNELSPLGASGPLVADKIRLLDDGHTPIYLLINSPGGSVTAGAEIISAMKASKSPVYTICTELCASMAFMIHQYGKERYMMEYSIIMSQQAAASIQGEVERMHSRLHALEVLTGLLTTPIAARAGITVERYRELVSNELWMSANDATSRGFNDAIVQLKINDALYQTQALSPGEKDPIVRLPQKTTPYKIGKEPVDPDTLDNPLSSFEFILTRRPKLKN